MSQPDSTTAPCPATDAGPDLAKGYEPQAVEAPSRWPAFWEQGRFFEAQGDSDKPAFSMILPPPNVTGSLHMGHALTATIEDIITRWHRMRGFNTLWLPGVDHAGIATQMIVEKELAKTEGKSRHDLGRDEFLSRVWEWKQKYGDRIVHQLKAIGASLDWSRSRFTMDEQSSRAVVEAFVSLHEQGLLYRAERLINWDVQLQTAVSDLEVDNEETKGELWSFAYPLADGSGEIVVATTRPETMLGDTAVAVHPDDERYKHLIGRHVRHPITGREFPIVGDAILVDPEFGSGAVKITPAHDFNDFEVGKRHGLPLINILKLDGTLNEHAGEFAGLDRFAARKAVKRKIEELGLFRGAKEHVLAVPKSQRTGTVIEPFLSTQWYLQIKPLADKAIEAVRDGRTTFVPDEWTKTYFQWMENIHDWCISRQLWWGHQIPAWYPDEPGHDGDVFVARTEEEAKEQARAKYGRDVELRRDPDVLDTWFSSGLWPFSTLGWPEKTADLRTFYPTTVMETGFDIIFFWVARMMMFGLHFMGEVPFKTVYLHAMVRDEKGEKMSKTKGNVIDPLQVTDGADAADLPKMLKDQYPQGLPAQGADALRFTLASMAAQGRDVKLSMKRVEGYRAFANKLWNAARFSLMNLEGYDPEAGRAATPAAPDRWILARTRRVVAEANEALADYRFSDYASGVYQFIWGDLCDWYIELSKSALYGDDANAKAAAQHALVTALDTALRLLHPAMPFVTEELWQRLPQSVRPVPSLSIAPFPQADQFAEDADIERDFRPVLAAILSLRAFRGESGIAFGKRFTATALAEAGATKTALERYRELVEKLTNTDVVFEWSQNVAHAVLPGEGFEVRVPLEGLVDLAEERTRTQKELAKLEAELGGLEKRLGNPSFVARAPKEVVEKDTARADELRARRDKLTQHLASLG